MDRVQFSKQEMLGAYGLANLILIVSYPGKIGRKQKRIVFVSHGS